LITYLRQRQIDKIKWDECIDKSINGLIYAHSWYLDIVSPGWEALIENDYESVMPLPQIRKYFLPCLIRPNFAQQLGIFSKNAVSQEKVRVFIDNIPWKFLWQDFNLNSQNPLPEIKNISKLQNYELSLNPDYKELCKGYNENTYRNIKKAVQAGITCEIKNEPHTFFELFKIFTRLNVSDKALTQLHSILDCSIQFNYGEIAFAVNSNRDIIAGALYVLYKERIIYLISFNSAEGQQSSAIFLIMDSMIKRYASQSIIFDFEGSMIPGIARFFAGFGAKQINYPRYQRKLVSWL
jgi:hypothetical protein